jgi:hypothetical protein
MNSQAAADASKLAQIEEQQRSAQEEILRQ